MDELTRVVAFRNRLVSHMNLVQLNVSLYGPPMTEEVRAQIAAERPLLAQEYGRMMSVINRWVSMQMANPMLGVTSNDVIQDAIHDIGGSRYVDICRFALQHLDTVIGRIEADVEGRRDPDAIYRVTSPVFWLQRLGALIRWLWGSTRRRLVTLAGVLILAIISGIVSGWAQALFTSALQ